MIVRLFRMGTLALAALYVVGGVLGVRSGLASAHGSASAYAASTPATLDLLDRARCGWDAPEIAWLSGEVALALADAAPEPSARRAALDRAAERYLEMTARTGGSAYALVGLAGAEERLEDTERAARTVDLSTLALGPWAQVGTHGRRAIGLLRLALDREPTFVAAHDALIATCLRFGLSDEAAIAARAAARAAPALEYHINLDVTSLPPEVVRAFVEGAHEALDDAPLAERERKLFYLGLLDERVGALDRAVEDLRAAHAEPFAGSIEYAETAFHLGRILVRLGRIDEAEAAFAESEISPVFAAATAVERARIDEKAGRLDAALARLAEARRVEPRSLELIVWEARLLATTGNRAAAVESLRWAVTIDATSRPARVALVRTLIDDGDRASARLALADFASALGEGDDTRALEATLRASP